MPAGPDEVVTALDRAGRLNPLFALAHGPAGADWRPATDLCRPDGCLPGLVASVGAWLSAPEPRVSASLVVLGYSARLTAPAVAVLLCDNLLLDLRPSAVAWRYATGTGFQLRLPAPSGWRGRDGFAGVPERWCASVVDEHLGPVVAAVRDVVPVAAGLLWGNVASSLAGALRVLAGSAAAPAADCYAVGQALLAYGPLAGSGRLSMSDGGLSFRRRSCCLYYRLPGGGMCGDCALLPDDCA